MYDDSQFHAIGLGLYLGVIDFMDISSCDIKRIEYLENLKYLFHKPIKLDTESCYLFAMICKDLDQAEFHAEKGHSILKIIKYDMNGMTRHDGMSLLENIKSRKMAKSSGKSK